MAKCHRRLLANVNKGGGGSQQGRRNRCVHRVALSSHIWPRALHSAAISFTQFLEFL